MTFRLEHHNKILAILESLDSDVFEEGSAYFGGGTLIALNFGEYRWSKDVDFICPVPSSGYKHLRTVVFEGGYEALFRDLNRVQVGRGTTDRYGIRMIEMYLEACLAEVNLSLHPGHFRLPNYHPLNP